jgi:hypothetical protein
MTEKELEKLDNEETELLLKKIDNNYASLNLPIEPPKYDKKGNLTNEKEVKKSLLLVLPILSVLWERNLEITVSGSMKIMSNNNTFFNFAKKGLKKPKASITVKEWNNIMDELIKKRYKQVKIKQVIKGNARLLNRRVQQTVLQMYREGKNYKQTAKELERLYGYNKNKAKSIAITEKNFYKSEAQLEATKGLNIKKTWVHTGRGEEARETHKQASGQTVKGHDTMFNVGGVKTIAPQHFGKANQDINCHCIMRIDLIDN